MELSGAVITEEGLSTTGGKASTVGNLDASLFTNGKAHSLEAKFKFTANLGQSGVSPLALDASHTASGGYIHSQFDAIVYNEHSSDRKWISGSEFYRGSKRPMTGDGVVVETTLDEFVHMVITYDPDKNLVTIYRNGEQYGDSYTPGRFMTLSGGNVRAIIGRRCDCRPYTVQDLNGVVTGAAVYDVALDAATVAKHYTHFTDLCVDVTCPDVDNDVCTYEYCDPDTGTCTSSDVECTDTNSCTVDTCDPTVGCVFTEMDCADGNICNGEEACIDGECVSPEDFSCPSQFVCSEEANSCLRDCTAFAIDGYLTDCSVEFDEHSNTLVELEDALSTLGVSATGIEERVTANAEEIAADALLIADLQTATENIAADVATNLENIGLNAGDIETNLASIETNDGLISTNTGNIATNTAGVAVNVAGIASNGAEIATNEGNIGTNVAGIAANVEAIGVNAAGIATNLESIGGLDARVEGLETRVIGFGPVADEGEGDGSNSLNGQDEVSSGNSVGIVPDLSAYHNEIIVSLMIVNVILVFVLVCVGFWYCAGRKQNKYEPVEMYSSVDEESRLKK
eukprot:133709_1